MSNIMSWRFNPSCGLVSTRVAAALLPALVGFLPGATALVEERTLTVPAGQAVFLEKFCFDFAPKGALAGLMNIEVQTALPSQGKMMLAVFDDEAKSYPDQSAFWGLDCDGERLKRTAVWLKTVNTSALPEHVTSPLGEKIRPRWWYAALVDCSGMDHVVTYKLHFENVRQGWQSELSMDRTGVPTLWFFLVVYAVLLAAQARAVTLKNSVARITHPLRVMLTISIAAAALGSMIQALDGQRFAKSGKVVFELYFMGKLFKALFGFTLMTMLLLLSKGHCISCALHKQDVLNVGKLIIFLAAGCLWLEVWGEYSQSRTYTTGYVFFTFYGFLLVLSDVGILALYLKNLRDSYRAELEEAKRKFYMLWGPLFALSFAVRPAMVVIGAMIAPWVRAAAVQIVTNAAQAVLLALLVVGLWPERTSPCLCLDNQEGLAKAYGMHSDLLNDNLKTDLTGETAAGPPARLTFSGTELISAGPGHLGPLKV